MQQPPAPIVVANPVSTSSRYNVTFYCNISFGELVSVASTGALYLTSR